jgi:hypothetical protein
MVVALQVRLRTGWHEIEHSREFWRAEGHIRRGPQWVPGLGDTDCRQAKKFTNDRMTLLIEPQRAPRTSDALVSSLDRGF